MVTIEKPDAALLRILSRYMHICNQAIFYNSDRFPYKQIWEAIDLANLRLKIIVTVIDGDRRFSTVMVLHDAELSPMPEACCGCAGCYGEERHWLIERQELETVVNHPQLYITQAARLDWDWLTPADTHLSEQGKPELQAEQAYSDNCSKERA